ncbi:MAG TPA: hypothetical protein VMV46_07040 [Thermoanaerobaculia bacterium]|nr:hypothetical protein [Thermoanaerobaculia bacterium]
MDLTIRPIARTAASARRVATRLMALIIALAASLVPAAAQQMTRSFEVHTVDTRVVETWIWDLCDRHPEESCRVVAVSPGSPSQLTVQGSEAVIAAVARLLAERDTSVARTQSFQIILVQGKRGAGGMDPGLPKPAVEALEDVRQFLPFDSFVLIDTALVSSTRDAETALSGPGGVRYDARIRFHRTESIDGPVIAVQTLQVESEPVWREPPVPPEGVEAGERPGGWTREKLLDTSLSLRVGETAVVGTSKLNGGDEALILLITALPSP